MKITTYIWCSFLISLLALVLLEIFILKNEQTLKKQETYLSLILLNLDLITDKDWVITFRKMITKKNILFKIVKKATLKKNKTEYLLKRIYGYPIVFVHELAKSCNDSRVYDEIACTSNNMFYEYKMDMKRRHFQARDNIISIIAIKGIFMFFTIIVYGLNNAYLTESVFIMLEVVGDVLIFANVMDVSFINHKINYAGNLAYAKWKLQIMMLNFDNSVKTAIIESYYIADKEIKKPLKHLIDGLNNNGDLAVLRKELEQELEQKNKKKKTHMPYIKVGYQALCSLGVMINVVELIVKAFENNILI